jgi:DNA-binding response OmpR family regulator
VAEEKPVILVVDDNAPIRIVLRQHLESAGYAVAEAATGEDAIAMIRDKPVQLVLLDVMMPGIDGIAVCKAVREKDETAFLPIVMVSAHGTPVYVKKARDSGASDFIVKPFSKKILLEKVEKWVGPPAHRPGAP